MSADMLKSMCVVLAKTGDFYPQTRICCARFSPSQLKLTIVAPEPASVGSVFKVVCYPAFRFHGFRLSGVAFKGFLSGGEFSVPM